MAEKAAEELEARRRGAGEASGAAAVGEEEAKGVAEEEAVVAEEAVLTPDHLARVVGYFVA